MPMLANSFQATLLSKNQAMDDLGEHTENTLHHLQSGFDSTELEPLTEPNSSGRDLTDHYDGFVKHFFPISYSTFFFFQK